MQQIIAEAHELNVNQITNADGLGVLPTVTSLSEMLGISTVVAI
jgi:hypothetical protein